MGYNSSVKQALYSLGRETYESSQKIGNFLFPRAGGLEFAIVGVPNNILDRGREPTNREYDLLESLRSIVPDKLQGYFFASKPGYKGYEIQGKGKVVVIRT